MSSYLNTVGVCLLATALWASASGQRAMATPEQSFGLSCTVCHDTPRDALRVNGDPEALPTFTVEAGKTVQLSFDVYREAGVFEKFKYVLGVGGLGVPGLNPSLGSDWEYRHGETYPYVLNDEYKHPHTFTLDVAVDLSTPADLYYMEAIVAGKDKYENVHENPWDWFGDVWDNWFPNFPEWTFGSYGMSYGFSDSSSDTEVKWFDLQPFYLRVTSPEAVPEPSTVVMLLTLVVGLSPTRIRWSRKMFASH